MGWRGGNIGLLPESVASPLYRADVLNLLCAGTLRIVRLACGSLYLPIKFKVGATRWLTQTGAISAATVSAPTDIDREFGKRLRGLRDMSRTTRGERSGRAYGARSTGNTTREHRPRVVRLIGHLPQELSA